MTLMAPPRAPRPPAARRLMYGDSRRCDKYRDGARCGGQAYCVVYAAPRSWPGRDVRIVTCAECDGAGHLAPEARMGD